MLLAQRLHHGEDLSRQLVRGRSCFHLLLQLMDLDAQILQRLLTVLNQEGQKGHISVCTSHSHQSCIILND